MLIGSLNINRINNIGLERSPKINNRQNPVLEVHQSYTFGSELQTSYGYIQNLDYSKIRQLNISNFRITNSKLISGSSFRDRSENDFETLKKSGITTMIDLRSTEDEILQKKCIDSKINYFKFPLDGVVLLNDDKFFYRNKDKSLHIKDDFIEMLKKFFNTLNNNKCYMACQHGIDRTNVGILLNYFFNKDTNKNIVPQLLCWDFERKVTKTNQSIALMKKIYKAMTDEQKAELGLSGEQASLKFQEKISKLKSKNRI